MSKDPVIRKRLVQLHFDALAQMYTAYRNLPAMIKGDTPGPEAYVNKVFGPQFFQRMNALGVEMQGPYGQLWLDSPEAVDEGVWPWQWAGARAVTIAGGTSEINRNLVAERALGLPSWKTAAKLAKEGKFVG